MSAPLPFSPALKIPVCLLAGGLALTGCAPVDQRTFDKMANRRPALPAQAQAPGQAPAAPFITIQQGTAPEVFEPAVAHAAKIALERKPYILFILRAQAPKKATAAAQQEALNETMRTLLVPVAGTLEKSGALPIQIEMQIRQVENIPKSALEVFVR